MKYQNRIYIPLALGLLGLLTACSPAGDPQAATSEANASAGPDLLLTDVPASAPSLLEALETSAPGETLLFSARVGGLREPLTEGYAAFVVADEALVFCDEMGDDSHCPTPWDACCEDPEHLAQARALVQFVDATGNPMAVDLKASTGLAENDTVIVRGTLSPDSTPENRIILAEGLAIVQ